MSKIFVTNINKDYVSLFSRYSVDGDLHWDGYAFDIKNVEETPPPYEIVVKALQDIWGFLVLSGEPRSYFSTTGDKRTLICNPPNGKALSPRTIKTIVFFKHV